MLPDMFYIVCFSIYILASIITLCISGIMIFIFIIHRPSRTIHNLMVCNASTAAILLASLELVCAGFALQKDWLTYQPACIFRSYLYVSICTLLSNSYTVQSISRLFFTVFYKHRQLLTWRVHRYLIIGNYLWAILASIGLLFIPDGLQFEIESRLCLLSSKTFLASMIGMTVGYLIPISIIMTVYGIIIYYARQSTRRVYAFRQQYLSETTSTITTVFAPNMNREVKLMTNIISLTAILVCSGLPYFGIMLWQAIEKRPVSEPLYLLVEIIISVGFTIEMVALFYMSNDIKTAAKNYCRKLFRLFN